MSIADVSKAWLLYTYNGGECICDKRGTPADAVAAEKVHACFIIADAL